MDPATLSLYLLRSRLAHSDGASASQRRMTFSSVSDLLDQASRELRNPSGSTRLVACVGSDLDEGTTCRTAERVTVMLGGLASDVKAIFALDPAIVVLVETIPSALFSVPAVQWWQSPPSGAMKDYEVAEAFNHALRRLAGTLGIWLLDCDRAVSRRGVDGSGRQAEPDCFERELTKMIEDASGPLTPLVAQS